MNDNLELYHNTLNYYFNQFTSLQLKIKDEEYELLKPNINIEKENEIISRIDEYMDELYEVAHLIRTIKKKINKKGGF